MTEFIHVHFKVKRNVFAMLFHGVHVLRHLHGQTAGGIVIAEDDVEHRGAGNTELDDDAVRFTLKLVHDHGVVDRCADNDGLVSHRFTAV